MLHTYMATPENKERPQTSGLSSSTVLDAHNDNSDSDYQGTDNNSNVVDCASEEELRTSNELNSTTSVF